METYYASPERSNDDEILHEIKITNESPILDSILASVSGLIAVLNTHRQIIAINNTMMEMLGIDDPHDVLGLRPGEAIKCIHADETEAGCGTSKYCSTCGAAISIVTSLSTHSPVERLCSIEVNHNKKKSDLFLKVKSTPIKIQNNTLILLFIQDISDLQNLSHLERVFFHDIMNIIQSLLSVSHLMLLEDKENKDDLAEITHQLTKQLANEVKLQRVISLKETNKYDTSIDLFSTNDLFKEIKNIFKTQDVSNNKTLSIPDDLDNIYIETDKTILMKVLTNMLLNAFEASDKGETIKLWIEKNEQAINFYTWNRSVIPEDIARRIFQKNFTTKEGLGRGLGTFSMRLFTEKFLGGEITFSSEKDKGTTFRLTLPI